MGKQSNIGGSLDARLASVMRYDAGSVLSKLETAGLIALGRVHLISFSAVKAAFEHRWDDRKAQVWDIAESRILKKIGPHDFCARVSELDFLLITPKIEKSEAQLLALQLSKEILHHFLGESYDQDISIKVVKSYKDQEIACQLISEKDLLAAVAANERSGSAKPAKKDPYAFPSKVSPVDLGAGLVVTTAGVRLRFNINMDPIIDLNQWAVAGHRLEPNITYEASGFPLPANVRRQLLPRDVETIDIATLTKGLRRLRGGQSSQNRPTIILSVSFLTLSNTKSRTALFDIAHPARLEMTRAIIWEITDFDVGIPAGRLQDCISALSPYARSVFARAETGTLSAISERSTGRCGLIFQPPTAFEYDEDAVSWLLATSRTASKRSATLIAANLPSKNLLPFASTVGFTHATVRQPAVTYV